MLRSAMFAVLAALLLAAPFVRSQTTSASLSGSVQWSDTATWSGGVVPIAVGSVANVNVNADASVTVNLAATQALLSFQIQKATLALADGVDFLSGTITMAGGTISMTGSATIRTATTFTANAGQPNSTIKGGVWAWDAATASAKVSEGAMLNIEGAVIKGGSNTITIGTDTGARAWLSIRSTTEATINAGTYDIKAMAQWVIQAQAAARVAVAAKAKGSGQFWVKSGGKFTLAANFDCSASAQVDGTISFLAGATANFGSIAFGDSSSTTFTAAGSGFTAVQVAGNAQLSGSVTVDLGSYVATTKVLLMKVAGTRTGVFASATITKQDAANPTMRRLLASGSGAVVYAGGEVYYDPNSALSRGPSVLLVALAIAVASLFRA